MILSVVFSFIFVGCASMPFDFEEPSLSITDITLRNSTGLSPQFDILLHITNPNRIPLYIAGMSYDLYLEGNKVVSGVSNNFPVVEAYGEADVTVNATISLLGSINLLSDLTRRSQDNLTYEFVARLDVGSALPRININRTGDITLR